MASPILESFCCMFRNETERNESYTDSLMIGKTIITYHALCILSSTLSIGGAIYQLFPKKPANRIRGERELQSVLRQNYLICWLTIADLLATIGILVRSSVGLDEVVSNNLVVTSNPSDFTRLFCAISSGWIQFFYISTYLWTFIFALDTYYLTINKQSYSLMYHIFCWGISAILCFAGLIPLYTPNIWQCAKGIEHLLPHFLSAYLPMLLTMVANPVLYSKASVAVQNHMYGGGSFTDRERQVINSLKMRFRAIIATFYVCWLPNLINGILIPVAINSHGKDETFKAVMFLTAVLNPLQGFLNSLVYKGIGLCPERYLSLEDHGRVMTNDTESSTRLVESSEASPLLRSRQSC